MKRFVIALAIIFGLGVGVLGVSSFNRISGRPPIDVLPPRYDPPDRVYDETTFDAVWTLNKEHDVWDGVHIYYHIHKKLLINNERGAERYLDYSISYNAMSSELTIQTASVTLPDGTVLEPRDDEIVDTAVSSRRMYSDHRKRVLHLPNLCTDAIVEVAYTIKSDPRIPGEYQSTFAFQDWLPIREAIFSLEFQTEQPVQPMMFLDWQVRQTNGIEELPLEFWSEGNIYWWKLEKSPGILPEYGMPPLYSIAPSIHISSYMAWSEIADWWWEKVEPLVDNLSPDIVTEARKQISFAMNEEQQVMLLYHWIEQYLGYVALEFGEGGMIPYAPNLVYERGFGDCKDGAVLLVAIARALGIDNIYPALINTGGGISPDSPTSWFNHAVAVYELPEKNLGSKWIVLDTTAKTYKYGDMPMGDQNRWMLVMGMDEDGWEVVQSPLYPPEHNSWDWTEIIYLSENGDVQVTIEWTMTGAYEAYFRYLMSALPFSQILGFFESYARILLPGSELMVDEMGYPAIYMENPTQFVSLGGSLFMPELKLAENYVISFSFSGKAPVEEDLIVFNIPAVDPLKGLIKKEWRYYDFIFSFPQQITHETIMYCPVDFKPLYLPPDWSVEGYWGTKSIEYLTEEDLGIDFARIVTRLTVETASHHWVPRRMYADYVFSVNEWALNIQLPIVLKRIEEG